MASLGVKSAGVPATASAPSEGSSDPDKQSHSLAATAPSAVGVCCFNVLYRRGVG